jgi:hypothetical protein
MVLFPIDLICAQELILVVPVKICYIFLSFRMTSDC